MKSCAQCQQRNQDDARFCHQCGGAFAAVEAKEPEAGAATSMPPPQPQTDADLWKAFIGMQPDIMTLAKGLGGGVPIGACLATDAVSRAFSPGTHASTFGGNPLACAAGIAVLRVLLDGKLSEKGRRAGETLAKGLAAFKERPRLVKDVRGMGLLQAIELEIDGKAVVADCLARGLLINCTVDHVLRFVPPLIITEPEIARLLQALAQIFSQRSTATH